MISKENISILGCGWLGFPLAKSLVRLDFAVAGSTTKKEKFKQLQKEKITPVLIDLNNIHFEVLADFLETDILIFTIPPSKLTEYKISIPQLIQKIKDSRIKKIIFISSTGVYKSLNKSIDEKASLRDLLQENSLFQIENLFRQIPHIKLTVLRLGGLVGLNRHPINFLRSARILENPEGRINYLFLSDGIKIISEIIEQECWNETFNCCMDEHPTKLEFYTKLTTSHQLPLPKFNSHSNSNNNYKIIDNSKIKEMLSFEFLKINALYEL